MAKTIIATIDTETASLNGEVFDIGVVIHDKKGNILATYDSIVKEVFDNVQLMKKAYYWNKVDLFYRPNVRCERMTVKPWAEICHDINKLMKIHGVTVVAAYNLGFDRRVIINTGKKYGGYLAINKREMLCLWRVACETLLQQKTFKKLAKEMDWISPAGNIRTNAEVAFKYGTGQWEFVESHTALDDALIEMQLAVRMFSLKKKINYGILHHPWRLVQGEK